MNTPLPLNEAVTELAKATCGADAYAWSYYPAVRTVLDYLVEHTAELIYLREYGAKGAVWYANESKEVWREKARELLNRQVKA